MDFTPWVRCEMRAAISAATEYTKAVSKEKRNDEERLNLMEKALREKGFSRSLDEIKEFYKTVFKLKPGEIYDVKSNPSLKHDILNNITEDKSKGKDTEKSKVEISSTSTEELKEDHLFCAGNGIATESQINQKILVNENNSSSVYEGIVNDSNKILTDNETEQMLKDMQTTSSRLKQDSVTKITNKSCRLKNQNQQHIDIGGIQVSSLTNNICNEQNLNDESLLKQNNLVEGGFRCLESVVQNVVIDVRKLYPTKETNINCTKIAPSQDTTNDPICRTTVGVVRVNGDENVLQNESQTLDKINVSKKRNKTSNGSKSKKTVQNVLNKILEQQTLIVGNKRKIKSFECDQTIYKQDLKSICDNNSNVLMNDKEENISKGSHVTDQTDLQDFNSSTHLHRVTELLLDNITAIGTSDCRKQSQHYKMSIADIEGIQVETQKTSKKETNLLAINLVTCAEKMDKTFVNSVMNKCKDVNSERLLTETPVQETKTHEIKAILNSESDDLVLSKNKTKSTSGVVASREKTKQKVLKETLDLCEEIGENNNKLDSLPTTQQMVNYDNDRKKPEVQTNRKSIDKYRRTRSNSIDVDIPTQTTATCTPPSATILTNAKEQATIAETKYRKSGDLKNKIEKTTPNKNNDSKMKPLVKNTLKDIADVENEICEIRENKTKKGRKASNISLIENNAKKFKKIDSLHKNQECKRNELKILPSTHQDEDKFDTRSNKKTNEKLKTHANKVNSINDGFRNEISTSQLQITSPFRHTTSKSTGRMSPTCHAISSGNSTTTRNTPAKGTENFNAAKFKSEFNNTFKEETPLKIGSGTNETQRIEEVIAHEIPIDINKNNLTIVENKIFEEGLLDNIRTEVVIDAHNKNIKVMEIKIPKGLHKNQEVQTLTDKNISQTIKQKGRKKKNSMTLIPQKESKIPCRRSKRKSIDFEKPTQQELSQSSTTTLNDSKDIDRSNDDFNGAGNENVRRSITSYENENSFEQRVSTLANKEIVQETKLLKVDSKIKCSNIEIVTDGCVNESINIKSSKTGAYNDDLKLIKSSGKLGNKGFEEPNKPFHRIQDNSDVCLIEDSNTTKISKPDTIIDVSEIRRRSTRPISQINTQIAMRGSKKEDTPGEQLNCLDSEVRRWRKLKRLKSGVKCLPKMIKRLTDQLKRTKKQINKETKKLLENHLQEIRREHEQLQTWFVEILKQVGHPPSKVET